MQENGIKIMALHLMLSTALHRSVPVIRQNWLPIICLIRLKGLKEIYLGTWEASAIVNNPEYPYGDYFIKYGGESLDQVTERIYHTIHELAEADNGNTILIVSHGLSIRRFLEKIGYRGLEREFIGNCGIVELQYENDIFTVKQVVNVNPEKPE